MADGLNLVTSTRTNVANDLKPAQSIYENIPLDDYDASNITPVFYGYFPRRTTEILRTDNDHLSSGSQTQFDLANEGITAEFNAAVAHPATFGYVLLEKIPVFEEIEEDETPCVPDPLKCSPKEYVEFYIFPILLPALEKMLIEAKANKVFEKRRTKFNACDFLTSYLYNNNPSFHDRERLELEDIPFVRKILSVNPRPSIPLSLLLSDDEAATIIQAYYKGYQVRKNPAVQELREYQKEMREEEFEINFKVEDFWHNRSRTESA